MVTNSNIRVEYLKVSNIDNQEVIATLGSGQYLSTNTSTIVSSTPIASANGTGFLAANNSGITAKVTAIDSAIIVLPSNTAVSTLTEDLGVRIEDGQTMRFKIQTGWSIYAIASTTQPSQANTTGLATQATLAFIANTIAVANTTAPTEVIEIGGVDASNKIQPVSVAQIHTGDQQSVGNTYNSLLTSGVAQLQTNVGNLTNRQREGGVDNASPLGYAAGQTNLAMAYKTSVTATMSAAATAATLTLAKGTIGGAPWAAAPGHYITVDPKGANPETVMILTVNTSTGATTFTPALAFSHTGPVTITGFTFNQERDIVGEMDIAIGQGGTPAFDMDFNGGFSDGSNYDRDRNAQGKGRTSYTISSGGGASSTSLTLSSSPPATGIGSLQGGSKVLLMTSTSPLAGTYECVNIDTTYIAGSTTVPLTSAIIATGPYTTLVTDSFNALGAAVNGGTMIGMEDSLDHIIDMATGWIYPEAAASKDAVPGVNVPMENNGLYNGTNFDRERSATAANGTTGTGVAASGIMGFDGTNYRRIVTDTTGLLSVGGSTTITSSPTVTASSAYTLNNQVGGLLTFASATGPLLSGILQSIRVTSKSVQTTGLKLYFFTTNPTNSTWTDKTAPAINAADIPFLAGEYTLGGADSGLGTHTIWNLDGIGKAFASATSTLYGILVTTGTPTFASTSDISVTISVLKD